jgi:hypothetical protein
MYSIWRLIPLFLVRILGLISCISCLGFCTALVACAKKPSVRYLDDSWTIEPPEVRIHNRKAGEFKALNSEFSKAPLSASVYFSSFERPSPQTRLWLVSSCSQGETQAEQKLEIPAQADIPLVNLVPLTLLAAPNDESFHCSIQLTARNAIGSTRTFEAKKVEISRADPTALLNIDSSQALSSNASWRGQVAHSKLNVVCSAFADAVEFQGEPTSDSLRTLLHRPLSLERLRLYRQIDPRVQYPRQSCRAVLERFTPGSRLSQRIFSSAFEVRFPAPAVNIRTQAHLGGLYYRDFINARAFSTTINNPNAFALEFRIPFDTGKSLGLQPVFHIGPTAYSQTPTFQKISWEVNGATNQWSDSSHLYFVVGAHQTVTLSAWIKDNRLICNIRRDLQMTTAPLSHRDLRMVAGFDFRLRQSLPLEMVLNTSEPFAVSETPETVVMDTWTTGKTNWVPQEYWTQKTGGERPATTLSSDNVICSDSVDPTIAKPLGG